MAYLKRLIPFFKPYRGLLVLLALAIIVMTIGNTITPYVLTLIVDDGISKLNMQNVTMFSLLLMGITIIRSAAQYLQGYWQGVIGANIVRDLRNTLYRKLQYLPFSWYAKTPTGQIMSRMMSDMDAVEQFVSFGFSILISEALILMFTLVMCLALDWQLTLFVLIPYPLLLREIVRFRSRIDPAWEAVREQMGKLTTVLQENVSGARVVKAFARESFAVSKFGAENSTNKEKNVYRAKLEADYFPSADFFSAMSWILLVLVGCIRMMEGTLTLGVFFAFNWYIWGLIWPLRSVGFLVNIMRQAAAAAPRLFMIFDAEETIKDRPDAIPWMGEGSGRVEFADVSFSFPDDLTTSVLAGLSFTVEPGQTVAILGGTGSGKSSVINLVPRFYDVTGGSVKLDGKDVREMRLKDVRGGIGIVPQETFLYSASLKENIAFGRPDATLEEVIEAAKIAHVHEFVHELPKGYDTKVGERGVGLSGGQKQRVALARAVIMNPRLLILDEATSAVDTATEAAIQKAMAQVMQGRTSIVVAQRLSTVLGADKIVVLKDGRVAEEGTHEQLYALGGEYRALYDLQLKEQGNTENDVIRDEEMKVSEDGRQKTEDGFLSDEVNKDLAMAVVG
ncbi:MAG: ABC transporter ATP-binding protein [Anaerolineae bacterium]|nr:ABC transporter ATP-binding protein [Thermoflexales bacterium]